MSKKNPFPTRFVTLLALIVAQTFLAPPAFAQETHHFEVQTTDVPSAVRVLGQQSGVQIFASADVLAGKKLNSVVGDMTTDAAFQRLLAGTGVEVRYVGDRSVALVADNRAGPAASDAASPPKRQDNFAATSNPDAKEASGTSGPSIAPSGADNSQRLTNKGSEPPKNTSLEEVIVTAQKRSERLQDVPMSVAVIGAADIDRRGLISEEDFLRAIPGVTQVASGAANTAIVIRGIETSPAAQNFSSGTTVATYFGESPTTNSTGIAGGSNVDIKLVDIERIEVLRGPQGTTFGSSSLGGAVRVLPAAPLLDYVDAKIEGNLSSTSANGANNGMLQGIVNLPLVTDKFAIRAVAYQFRDRGYYRNTAGSDVAFQATATSVGAQAFAVNDDHVGDSTTTATRVAALWKITDNLKLSLNYLHQTEHTNGDAIANAGTYEQMIYRVAPQHTIRGQTAGASDTNIDLTNMSLDYNLGWAGLLVSATHTDSGAEYAGPAFSPPSPYVPYSGLGSGTHREKDGEVRLTSQFQGPWKLLAGLYAEDLKDYADFNYRQFGTGAANFGDYINTTVLKQKSIFGEVSYDFWRGFTLTGGGRAYQYERTGKIDQVDLFFSPTTSTSVAADASGSSFKGSLSYKVSDNAMAYALWSQGFRLGKPQPALAAGLCDINSDGILDGTTNVSLTSTGILRSDSVRNFELGTKLTLLDRRLIINADVYRINWDGVPVRVLAPGTPGSTDGSGCGLAYNANAGKATSEGMELQASYYLTKALMVDVGGSTTHAVLNSEVPAIVGATRGATLPGSPRANANLALQFSFDVAGHATWVRADSFYQASFYGDFAQDSDTKAGGYVKADVSARTMFNKWGVELFIHNVTNADDYTFRGVGTGGGSYFGYRLRPRSIGVQVSYEIRP